MMNLKNNFYQKNILGKDVENRAQLWKRFEELINTDSLNSIYDNEYSKLIIDHFTTIGIESKDKLVDFYKRNNLTKKDSVNILIRDSLNSEKQPFAEKKKSCFRLYSTKRRTN